jgi:hypothetical protein
MELEESNPAMELTSEQAWNLLREELLYGLDSGELTEEEFIQEMKVLRAVVSRSTFTLVTQPIADGAEEQNNGGPYGQ